MKLAITALVLLSSLASAQLRCERSLVPEATAGPVRGIPADGLWARQDYAAAGSLFEEPGTLMERREFSRIRWTEGRHAYSGPFGGWRRAVWLGPSRLMMEMDLDTSDEVIVFLGEVEEGSFVFYDIEKGPDSPLVAHLRGMGLRVDDGGTLHGSREAILAALRDVSLSDARKDYRLERPTYEEMGRIWNYFDIEIWAKQQGEQLRQAEEALRRPQLLGGLHLAHWVASNASDRGLANLDPYELMVFKFGHTNEKDLAGIYERAQAVLKSVQPRIKERMTELAAVIEVLQHDEYELDPENPFDFAPRPGPGAAVEYHIQVKRADGAVVLDSRAEGAPRQGRILADMPEGLQFALMRMALGETMTVRIPAKYAFGPEAGTVEVALELLRFLPDPVARPPVEGLLRVEVGTVVAEETPSGLRYRDTRVGEGATPKRGDTVQLALLALNAMGETLDEAHAMTAVLGSDALLPGVTEGVLSMKVGGQRLLYIPWQLADTRPERSGLAQCVLVELRGIGKD